MPSKLLIKGASVWTDGEFAHETDLLIEDGRIARIGRGLAAPAARAVDARGWLLLPGFVDLHAHLGEPGRDDRESLESGLEAAGWGGFTQVLAMPDTEPPIDDEAGVLYLLAKGARLGGPRLHVCGAATRGRQGKAMAELGQMFDAGALAFGDAAPLEDGALLRRILEYARMLGAPLLLPAEDETLAAGGLVHDGPVGSRLGLAGIPHAAEWTGLARALLFAEGFQGRIHVQGVSTARSVEMLAEAKRRGIAATAECSFHHLLMNDEALDDYDTSKKLKPPLRPQSDVEALIEGVRSGAVDCIVTDHTPATPEEKAVEFDQAPFGAAGLEAALPALYDRLVAPGILSWSDLVRAMSESPRRVLGLALPLVGEGEVCEFTLFDPEGETRIEPERWKSRGRNTPFKGVAFQGRVEGILVGARAAGPIKERIRE